MVILSLIIEYPQVDVCKKKDFLHHSERLKGENKGYS